MRVLPRALPALPALLLALAPGCRDACISDNDHDGFYSANLCRDGMDCDDLDPDVSPGATEVCDSIDNDCDGGVDNTDDIDVTDQDRDGYPASACALGTDCDDQNAGIHPGVAETCNDVDEDCDGIVDNKDVDGDGSVDADCGGSDCDDDDTAFSPNASELCSDGLDNNCNGTIDGGDADADGYPSDECAGGTDCNDADPTIHPGEVEFCDDIDQDCDGLDDDVDADGDGDYSPYCGGDDCDDTDPTVGPSSTDWCDDGIDNNCDGVTDYQDDDGDYVQPTECGGNDCDDHDATTTAGMSDVCGDGKDNDCNGTPDDKDEDYDNDIDAACGGTDCDDADPLRSGLLPEQCDAVDSDCDADLLDADHDEDGASANACGGQDCNDSLPNVSPTSPEVCDGLDNDCDGLDDDCFPRLPGGLDFVTDARGWSADTGWAAGSGAVTFTGTGDEQVRAFAYEDYRWQAPYLIEVDLARLSGAPEAGIGLQVCDDRTCENGVYAWVHEDKGFRVQMGRIDNGVRTSEHNWRPIASGHQGTGVTNRLRIYHSGTRLYADVNGIDADDVYVSDLTAGFLQIVAEDLPGDSSTGTLQVRADNVYGSE